MPAVPPPPLLQAARLAIGFGARRRGTTLVQGIDATVHAGELICLLGPNGAGKSTLLRTLAGLQPPRSGEILLSGRDIASFSLRQLAKRRGIVLTVRIEAGDLLVSELVALGRHPHTDWTGRLAPADRAAVERAVAAVGLESLAHRRVGELSDGERQKAFVARALAQEADLLILDEPTAFLDLPRRVELLRLLRRLTREAPRAVLLSTHDLDLALRTADRLWLLPPGGPLRAGRPEDLLTDGGVARLFQPMTRVDGVFGDGEGI